MFYVLSSIMYVYLLPFSRKRWIFNCNYHIKIFPQRKGQAVPKTEYSFSKNKNIGSRTRDLWILIEITLQLERGDWVETILKCFNLISELLTQTQKNRYIWNILVTTKIVPFLAWNNGKYLQKLFPQNRPKYSRVIAV